MITDTHCHLDFEYDYPLDEVIARAKEREVTRLITVGTSLGRSRESVRIAEHNEGVWATVGIHPDAAHEVTDEGITELRQLADSGMVVAIGEIGLDLFHPDNPSLDIQREAALRQALLARECELPVIVHSRRAQAETLSLLDEMSHDWPTERLGVVHCFEGEQDFAQAVLDKGFYLSFTANLTYPKNDHLREVVRHLPLDRLMVETDAPFLPPQRIRGQRNEPGNVTEVVAVIAECRGVAMEEVAETTSRNAATLFDLHE